MTRLTRTAIAVIATPAARAALSACGDAQHTEVTAYSWGRVRMTQRPGPRAARQPPQSHPIE